MYSTFLKKEIHILFLASQMCDANKIKYMESDTLAEKRSDKLDSKLINIHRELVSLHFSYNEISYSEEK